MANAQAQRERERTRLRLHSTLALSSSSNLRGSGRLRSGKAHPGSPQTPDYKPLKVLGQGAFGVVYSARAPDGSVVAIKKVLIDPRYKNRELEVMQQIDNRYVVRLLDSFRTAGRTDKEVYINLVMDFLPQSLHQFNLDYRKDRKYPPLLYVKLFAYQIFAGLHYLHTRCGVTHRDLKPQNILVDPESGELKICDLGSAKKLVAGEPSVSYIASRYYRAPELIFDCVHYSPAIDIWAGGCCLAEMLMAGMPLFVGTSSLGQLHEIVKVLGPPSDDDMDSFEHSASIELAPAASATLEGTLPRHTPPDVLDLLRRIFVYNPERRPSALECMGHACFAELFELDIPMPSKRPLPVLERG
jgi:serine/threonine protein kinase